MDTLTTGRYLEDQRRYLRLQPTAAAGVAFLRQVSARSFDADGQALVARVLRALLAGLAELAPPELAPRAQHALYATIRRAAWLALQAMTIGVAAGADGPILDATAADALAQIEAQDVVLATPSGRAADLAVLLAGLSWRAN